MEFGYKGIRDFYVKIGEDDGHALTLDAHGVWERGGGYVGHLDIMEWIDTAENGAELEEWYGEASKALESDD